MTQTKEEKAAYNRAWYAKHGEEQRAKGAAYRAAHREEKAAYNAIYKLAHKEERARKRLADHEEYLARDAAYRATHRDTIITTRKAYSAGHLQVMAEACRRRRARQRTATIGHINLEAIKQRDRMRCAICGKRVSRSALSFDHSWPLSLGGPHSQENQRVAHLRCNARRGAGRLPVQMVLF